MKYEYKIIWKPRINHLEAEINEWGQLGWKAVNLTSDYTSGIHQCLMMKEKLTNE